MGTFFERSFRYPDSTPFFERTQVSLKERRTGSPSICISGVLTKSVEQLSFFFMTSSP